MVSWALTPLQVEDIFFESKPCASLTRGRLQQYKSNSSHTSQIIRFVAVVGSPCCPSRFALTGIMRLHIYFGSRTHALPRVWYPRPFFLSQLCTSGAKASPSSPQILLQQAVMLSYSSLFGTLECLSHRSSLAYSLWPQDRDRVVRSILFPLVWLQTGAAYDISYIE